MFNRQDIMNIADTLSNVHYIIDNMSDELISLFGSVNEIIDYLQSY